MWRVCVWVCVCACMPAVGRESLEPQYVVPGVEFDAVPGVVPSVVPGVVPGAAPGVVPSVVPGVVPGAAPGVAPVVEFDAAPGVVPSVAPGVVPGAAPGVVPGAVPGMAPAVAPAVESCAVPGAARAKCSYVGGGRLSDNEREFLIDGAHNIITKYVDGRYLEVKCNGWAVLDSDALPRFNSMIRVPLVTLVKCPPPEAGSFARSLSALNVTLLRSGQLWLTRLPPFPQLHARHFVGLEVLEELKLVANAGARPEPVPGFLGALRGLRSLEMRGVQLAPGELVNLPASLTALKLKYSGIHKIPEAFLTRPNLWKLELEEENLEKFSIPQQLHTLTVETKKNIIQVGEIPSLETLVLIKWLEPRPVALVRCVSLRALKLSSPALEALPERWVALCPRLRNLAVNNANHLKSLPPNLLENATALENLALTNSVLESLPEGLFHDVQNLRTLDLRRNHLRTIASGAFMGLRNLQKLDLSSNLLTAEALEPVSTLFSLTRLNLAHNSLLSDLCDHSFGYSHLLQLKRLAYLSLIKTKITRTCRDWRENLTFLETMDLRQTNITELRFSDLLYTRDDSVNAAEVLLDGAPVVSVIYSEDEFKMSQLVEASKAKVQLFSKSGLDCDCRMYWARLALFPLDNKKKVQVTGLNCSNGRRLQDMSPEEMRCRADAVCSKAELPPPCECWARPEAGRRISVRVHCDGAGLRAVPPLPARADYVYDLELPNNNISSLHVADLPPNWREVDVRNNSVERVEGATARALVQSPRRLRLAGNPLACGCGAAPLLLALQAAAPPQTDLGAALCADGTPLTQASTAFCTTVPMASWLVPVLAVLFAVTTTMVAFLKIPKRRKMIKALLERCGLLHRSPEEEDGFLFDVFVSFSHVDEQIVLKLVKGLEEGPKPYRLCLHYRDWIPGNPISNQIVESVRLSRRTLAVVSQAFLDSTWARAEFREAYRDATSRRLIVVLLDDPEKLRLDGELQRCLSTKTYVRWGDPWFWDKLRQAIPPPRGLTERSLSYSISASRPAAQISGEWTTSDDRLTSSIDTTDSSPKNSANASAVNTLVRTQCVAARE